MNTYTLKIEKLGTQPSLDGLTNVVKYVSWRCYATDGVNTTSIYKETLLESPSENAFTAFENLTEKEVVSWITSLEDMNAIHSSLDSALIELSQPKIIEKEGPWAIADKYVPTHMPHEKYTAE